MASDLTLALPSNDLPAFEAPVVAAAPLAEGLHFAGRRGDYWRLMIRGALLQAVTLGLYRFWLFTDMRRFLWANTEIGGDSFEYAGTAMELLLGFLVGIAILVPVYVLLFVASLEMGGLNQLSGVFAFLVLALFGQYAAYRARRYRLSRTIWRGLRFHQTGSAVRYAFYAALWWIAVGVTFGLAYPWMEASLERYKMRNTFYGTLGGRFAATGTQLFARGGPVWLLVIAPLPLAVWSLWSAHSFWANVQRALPAVIPVQGVAILAGLAGSVLAAVVMFPAFQAIVMRWWLGGIRFGAASASSKLRIRLYYGTYLRYILCILLLTVIFAIMVGIGAAIMQASPGLAFDFEKASPLREAVMALGALGLYVVYILGCSTVYQVMVKFRLWQVAVESVAIAGAAALDGAHSDPAMSSALGEGLADALGGGAI